MIKIVASSKSLINVSYDIYTNNRINDILIVKNIAEKYKCIKFFTLNYSDSIASYEIVFRAKNESSEAFEEEIKRCGIYDENIGIEKMQPLD